LDKIDLDKVNLPTSASLGFAKCTPEENPWLLLSDAEREAQNASVRAITTQSKKMMQFLAFQAPGVKINVWQDQRRGREAFDQAEAEMHSQIKAAGSTDVVAGSCDPVPSVCLRERIAQQAVGLNMQPALSRSATPAAPLSAEALAVQDIPEQAASRRKHRKKRKRPTVPGSAPAEVTPEQQEAMYERHRKKGRSTMSRMVRLAQTGWRVLPFDYHGAFQGFHLLSPGIQVHEDLPCPAPTGDIKQVGPAVVPPPFRHDAAAEARGRAALGPP
jgi:hypothetical protein